MLKKIILATDGSEYALAAGRFLAALPLPPGTAIQVVCVVDVFVERVLETVQPGQRDRALRVVEAAAATVRREGLEVTTATRSGDADHQLILAAEEWGADVVVLGSKGLTGLESFVLGSVARNVAKHAHCPALVVRGRHDAIRNVILATDGSPQAGKALDFAAELPLPAETEVTLVHVVRPEHPVVDLAAIGDARMYDAVREAERERRERGEELLRAAGARLEEHGRRSILEVREGDPAAEILEAAEEKAADLIVAGARGVSLIRGLVVGSVADRLLKKAQCSVLIGR